MVSASGSLGLHSSLQLLQPSVMSASEKPKKLKIKISKLSAESEIVSVEDNVKSLGNKFFDVAGVSHSLNDLNAHLSINRTGHTTTYENEKTVSRAMLPNCSDALPADRETMVSERGNMRQISLTNANKRAPMMTLDNQNPKRQKLDSGVLVQCTALLKKLMAHKDGWVFKEPVDPVKLRIPDYFTVIKRPMDLGTIRSKLAKKSYFNAEDFAADVRLTFDNAMLYNPPTNDVHHMAEELKLLFESRWSALTAKWSASVCSEYGKSSVARPSKPLYSKQNAHRTEASCPKASSKVVMPSVQRQKLRKDLEELSKIKAPILLLDQIRKMGLMGEHDHRINVDIDAVDEITVCKLQKLIRSFNCLRSVEPTHKQYTGGRVSLQQDLHKGNGNNSANTSACISAKSQMSSACINGSSESMNSRGSHQNDFRSDVDSERSSGRNINNTAHLGSHGMDLPGNAIPSRQATKSDPDSDGGVSAVDEEIHGPSSQQLATASSGASASDEGWDISMYDAQLSPSKALRAARLKSRFADTIVKARQMTLSGSGEKSDPVKMRQEKERLERQQREERARIEAQIRAAEAASRLKEEMELKKRRERDREAARIALQQVERSVEIYENIEILREFEMLGGRPEPEYFLAHNKNPLERLGLFIKMEYLEEEEDNLLESSSGVVLEMENSSGGDAVEEENSGKDNEGSEKCSGGENCDGDVEEGEIAS